MQRGARGILIIRETIDTRCESSSPYGAAIKKVETLDAVERLRRTLRFLLERPRQGKGLKDAFIPKPNA